MAFVLPSFGAASNYAASFTPVQPLLMPDNVKSTAFVEALKEADQLEYAAAAQLGKAAIGEKGAIIRRQLAEEGALERLELSRKMTKAQKLLALSKLGDLGGGRKKGDPLNTQLGITQQQAAMSKNRHDRLAGSKAFADVIRAHLPAPTKHEIGASFDLSKLNPQGTTIQTPDPVASTLDTQVSRQEQADAMALLKDALAKGLITPEQLKN